MRHGKMQITGDHILHFGRKISECMLCFVKHIDQLTRVIVERLTDIVDLLYLLQGEMDNHLDTVGPSLFFHIGK